MKFKSDAWVFARGLALLLSLSGTAWGQLLGESPDWTESTVPPPPAFEVSKLVRFDVAASSSLVYGVDPASISISRGDGVVRYVMVATSAAGATNVMYEGLRCATGEVKTYARYLPDSRWQPVADAQWRSVFDNLPSRHALRFAKAGACDGAAPADSVPAMVKLLKNPYSAIQN